MQKEEKIKTQQIETLNNIIKYLENTLNTNFEEEKKFSDNINTYGIINYSRTQYFPQLSSYITKNEDYKDTFYNYITVESMIVDLFLVIESDLIKSLDTNSKTDTKRIKKIITFTIKPLKILQKILTTKNEYLKQDIDMEEYDKRNTQYTKELSNIQNKYYTIIYDEKIDHRIK